MAALTAAAASAGDPPACGPFGNPPARFISTVKPDCGAGVTLGPWRDPGGADRYACLYRPGTQSVHNKLPLVVYLHPSLFTAQTIARTNLLDFHYSYALSGDPARPGFIMLAPQGRNTSHQYPFFDRSGTGWDNWYRSLAADTPRANVDAAAIDHFIATEVATGEVDTDRIYVTGWSNGGAMAILYALNRPMIAAAAVYSTPDPFGAFSDPCPQRPTSAPPASAAEVRIANPGVPILHLHNACDIAGICPNSEQLAAELRTAGVSVRDVIVDSSGRRVMSCDASCGTSRDAGLSMLRHPESYYLGLDHHSHWPVAWDRYLLDFMRRNPLGHREPSTSLSR